VSAGCLSARSVCVGWLLVGSLFVRCVACGWLVFAVLSCSAARPLQVSSPLVGWLVSIISLDCCSVDWSVRLWVLPLGWLVGWLIPSTNQQPFVVCVRVLCVCVRALSSRVCRRCCLLVWLGVLGSLVGWL
jgi:hypothetical protein